MERGTEKFIIQGTQCYFSQLKCCGHSGAGIITSSYSVFGEGEVEAQGQMKGLRKTLCLMIFEVRMMSKISTGKMMFSSYVDDTLESRCRDNKM